MAGSSIRGASPWGFTSGEFGRRVGTSPGRSRAGSRPKLAGIEPGRPTGRRFVRGGAWPLTGGGANHHGLSEGPEQRRDCRRERRTGSDRHLHPSKGPRSDDLGVRAVGYLALPSEQGVAKFPSSGGRCFTVSRVPFWTPW